MYSIFYMEQGWSYPVGKTNVVLFLGHFIKFSLDWVKTAIWVSTYAPLILSESYVRLKTYGAMMFQPIGYFCSKRHAWCGHVRIFTPLTCLRIFMQSSIHFMSTNNTCQEVFVEALTFVIFYTKSKIPLTQLSSTPPSLRGKLVITSFYSMSYTSQMISRRGVGGEALCLENKLIFPCLPLTSLCSKVC